MTKKVTIDDFKFGNGSQGAKVGLLAGGLVRVVGAGAHFGRKIFNADDLILGKQQPA